MNSAVTNVWLEDRFLQLHRLSAAQELSLPKLALQLLRRLPAGYPIEQLYALCYNTALVCLALEQDDSCPRRAETLLEHYSCRQIATLCEHYHQAFDQLTPDECICQEFGQIETDDNPLQPTDSCETTTREVDGWTN